MHRRTPAATVLSQHQSIIKSPFPVGPAQSKPWHMTNGVALFLAVLIIGFFTLDHYVLHLDALQFLFRRMISVIDILAFWR